jgi:hypothetical protein
MAEHCIQNDRDNFERDEDQVYNGEDQNCFRITNSGPEFLQPFRGCPEEIVSGILMAGAATQNLDAEPDRIGST